ncbi:39S ribosomal protein L53/MRP-L53-domain-containing protein [Aspergillus californicus]
MSIPLQTITTLRTSYNPFLRTARPCRLLLSLLRNPSTIPASSPTHINIKVTQLPRASTQVPTMTIGFKGGKELNFEFGKGGLKIGEVVEEIARVGRAIEREDSLKG